MTLYKCGHERVIVIMDKNPLSFIAYNDWKKTVGFEGDRSLCWDCWCKNRRID